MRQTHKDGSEIGHKWEKMGAVAPYAYKGFSVSIYQASSEAPKQAGTTCDYCGTGIMNVFYVQDSNGKEFKLGCECIKALNSPKLTVLVESKVRELNRLKKAENEVNKVNSLEADYLQALTILSTIPHPNSHFAKQGKTYADYVNYCSKNSKNMLHAIRVAKLKRRRNDN